MSTLLALHDAQGALPPRVERSSLEALLAVVGVIKNTNDRILRRIALMMLFDGVFDGHSSSSIAPVAGELFDSALTRILKRIGRDDTEPLVVRCTAMRLCAEVYRALRPGHGQDFLINMDVLELARAATPKVRLTHRVVRLGDRAVAGARAPLGTGRTRATGVQDTACKIPTRLKRTLDGKHVFVHERASARINTIIERTKLVPMRIAGAEACNLFSSAQALDEDLQKMLAELCEADTGSEVDELGEKFTVLRESANAALKSPAGNGLLHIAGAWCDHCRRARSSDRQLHRCAKCRMAYYCSAECQRDAWREHRGRCRPAGACMEGDFVTLVSGTRVFAAAGNPVKMAMRLTSEDDVRGEGWWRVELLDCTRPGDSADTIVPDSVHETDFRVMPCSVHANLV